MAVFLSPEWLKEMDEAAASSTALAALGREHPFVVQQRVTGAPQGDVTYQIVIDETGGRVLPEGASTPNLALTTDFATACALHSGATNAQQALIRGQLKVGGDAQELVRRADVLEALDDVFAAVRARTTLTGS